jgi:hypothetical protein
VTASKVTVSHLVEFESEAEKMYVASPFEQSLFDEGDRIIGGARDREIVLRLLGALAIRTHCQKFS